MTEQNKDMERTVVQTATEVKGIREDLKEIKDGQKELFKVVGETKVALGKINWLPKAVMGIVMAIVGRALWIISK